MSSLVWVPLVALGVLGLAFGRRITGRNDRMNVSWLDAWLKSAVIVIAVVLLTVIVPDQVVRSGAVANKSRVIQELVGVALWVAGLTIVVGTLWYAHRESRL